MSPVLILRFDAGDGPGFLGDWLRTLDVPHRLIALDRGEPLPDTFDNVRGIAALGGPMSVNDALPMLRATETLLRTAVERDVPVLGHCLGGQLLASALGAKVERNPVPEIGWHRVRFDDVGDARRWFGCEQEATVFEWHADTFGIPRDARLLAGGAHCAHQVFEIGRSIAMQFHIEIDAPTIERWIASEPQALCAPAAQTGVQTQTVIDAHTAQHLAASQAMAAHLFSRWIALGGDRG